MKKISTLDHRSGIYTITPEDAEKILAATSDKNRAISLGRVNKYVHRMKAGRWPVNGEAIIFSLRGELLDGQHRLRACAESGKHLETVVLYGDFNFVTMGQGAARSGGDCLGIMMPDVIDVNSISAIATLCIKHDRALKREGSPYCKTARDPDDWMDIDNQDRLAWVRKNPRASELLLAVRKALSGDQALLSASVLAAGWLLAEAVSSNGDAEEFFIPLITGIGLRDGDVRLNMRRNLANRPILNKSRVGGIEGLHWLGKAWQARNETVNRKAFMVKRTENFPFFR